MGHLSAPTRIGAAVEDVTALSESGAPYALFLDIDGTLLDLAARPDNVVIPPGLIETLARVERKLSGALALVSGRPITEIDRLFEPLRLRASGVHGAEMRLDPLGATAFARTVGELPQALVEDLRRMTEAFPGALVEDKRFSFAIHYRRIPSMERPLREAVRRVLAHSETPLEVLDAHYAIEVKSPGCDKGSAIAAFLETAAFRGRRPVFVGDDTTDESGLAMVSARGGYAFSVGQPRGGAIAVFKSPGAVRAWLAEFAARGEGQ